MTDQLPKKYKGILRLFCKNNKGGATVEFVATLPLILVAFVFAFEFSRLFWAHHIAVNNVRSAVRYISRAPLTTAYIDSARNIAKTGSPNTSTGAYEWQNVITDANIDINQTYRTFTDTDFRTSGQVVRMQMDIPFSFMTIDMANNFTGGAIPTFITLNIIEEARYYGE